MVSAAQTGLDNIGLKPKTKKLLSELKEELEFSSYDRVVSLLYNSYIKNRRVRLLK